jgi:hypothetical protein
MSEIAELRKEIARLERSIELLQAFVDSETRERMGLTSEEIRARWNGRPKPPEFGPL